MHWVIEPAQNKGDKDFVWGLWKSMSFRGDKSHTIHVPPKQNSAVGPFDNDGKNRLYEYKYSD